MTTRPGQKFICLLCKRKFPTQEALKKHEKLSELHKNNLEKQKKAQVERREFLRRDIRARRHNLIELMKVEAKEAARADETGPGGLFDSMQRKEKINQRSVKVIISS